MLQNPTLIQIENKKTIIHIFNSSYHLDYKIEIQQLVFYDFYSHELSLTINLNDYKI